MSTRELLKTQETIETEQTVSIDELIEQTRKCMPEDRPSTVREQMKYAQGYLRIRNAWTKEDIQMARETANKQLGHMTDGKNYSDDQYRDILTTASLWDARIVGNEFCVFSDKKGNARVFRQKDYWRRRMLDLPGFANFSWVMGDAAMSATGKCARVSGSATWVYQGVKRELACIKTGDRDDRLTVKCWETDTPDQIIGKAEARLFAKVYADCTGSLWAKEDAEALEGEASAKETDGVAQ